MGCVEAADGRPRPRASARSRVTVAATAGTPRRGGCGAVRGPGAEDVPRRSTPMPTSRRRSRSPSRPKARSSRSWRDRMSHPSSMDLDADAARSGVVVDLGEAGATDRRRWVSATRTSTSSHRRRHSSGTRRRRERRHLLATQWGVATRASPTSVPTSSLPTACGLGRGENRQNLLGHVGLVGRPSMLPFGGGSPEGSWAGPSRT